MSPPVTGHLRRLLLAGLLTTPAAIAAAWAWFTRDLPRYDDRSHAQECEQVQRRLRERRQGTRYG